MEETITVEITKDDIEKAGDYWSPRQCLLAQALRRLHPKSFIEVYEKLFQVDGEYYCFGQKTVENLKVCGGMIRRGRRDKIKPFTFEAYQI